MDAELSGFCVKYKVTVKQKAYAEAVQRLLYQYNHYIHLKLEEDVYKRQILCRYL